MDAKDEKQVIEWLFPDLNQKITPAASLENAPPQETEQERKFNQLMNDYQNRIELLNHIFEKMQQTLALFDDEIISLINTLVKNAVKKIIYQELQNDNDLLKKMINELMSLVEAKQGELVTVSLSPLDFEKLRTEEASNQNIKVDPTLSVGDIIVKSHFTEIRALLNERIQNLMENSHD